MLNNNLKKCVSKKNVQVFKNSFLLKISKLVMKREIDGKIYYDLSSASKILFRELDKMSGNIFDEKTLKDDILIRAWGLASDDMKAGNPMNYKSFMFSKELLKRIIEEHRPLFDL